MYHPSRNLGGWDKFTESNPQKHDKVMASAEGSGKAHLVLVNVGETTEFGESVLTGLTMR